VKLSRLVRVDHPLALQFQRAVESITAAQVWDSARQYTGTARDFLIYLAGVYWEHRSSALTDFPKLFPAYQMARSEAIRFCITLYKTFL
jgi:hypothetical protein